MAHQCRANSPTKNVFSLCGKVYSGVSRQVGNEPGLALRAVGKQLGATGMSWPRLVSLFAVAGGLACDTVRAGRPEQMTQIADAMADLVDEELASWIADNGGWVRVTN